MRAVLPNLAVFRDELDSCLFSSIATSLRHHGLDDGLILGGTWDFAYPTSGIVSEEYFVPRSERSLLQTLAPCSGLMSAWRTIENPDDAWEETRGSILRGCPTIVAVDNYFLPFRPAYGDVHSKHLVTVYGFDDEREMALVLDATPPRYMGEIPLEALRNARCSRNVAEGDRDFFFADSPIANDTLELLLNRSTFPDPAVFALQAIRANIAAMSETSSPGWLRGIDGIRELVDLADADAEVIARPLFIFTGTLLAQRARHVRFLKRAARMIGRPRLRAAATALEDVVYRWATVRILCSREIGDRPAGIGARLGRALADIATREEACLKILKVTCLNA